MTCGCGCAACLGPSLNEGGNVAWVSFLNGTTSANSEGDGGATGAPGKKGAGAPFGTNGALGTCDEGGKGATTRRAAPPAC